MTRWDRTLLWAAGMALVVGVCFKFDLLDFEGFVVFALCILLILAVDRVHA